MQELSGREIVPIVIEMDEWPSEGFAVVKK